METKRITGISTGMENNHLQNKNTEKKKKTHNKKCYIDLTNTEEIGNEQIVPPLKSASKLKPKVRLQEVRAY